MKRFPISAAVALILAAASLTSCTDMLDCIQGSGVFRTSLRTEITPNVADTPFTRVRLEGSVDVILSQGPYAITIEGDDNLIDLVTTTVSSGTLVVDNRECYSSSRPLVARVSLPKLEALSINGSGDAGATTGFTADQISIAISGSGDIELGVETPQLNTSSSGSGDISLRGHAARHLVELSGSGDLGALDLQTEETSYTSRGSGDGRIAVSRSLVVEMSGSGDLAYRGSPADYRANVTGSGEVSRLP